MRLNKYLSAAGVCSRRDADKAAKEGRITVNGKEAVPGCDIEPGKDEVRLDGKLIDKMPDRIVIAYNKPAGVVCSTVSQGRERNDIITVLGLKERVYPIGRLDKDSTGLILLTNDGELTQRALRGKNGHEKEYIVKVSSDFSLSELREIENGGIPIEEKRSTRPCRVKKTGKCEYDFILTEGMNRQIRKVCKYFGKTVVSLNRIRFMNIRLDDLKVGEYRILSPEEADGL